MISGEVTLTLKNPGNIDSDQLDSSNITITVNGVKRCKYEDEGSNPDQTQSENSDNDRSSTATVAVCFTIATLITVSLIVGFILWVKKKQIQIIQTEAPIDENPAYGVYEEYENGEVRSETTAEVIDTSPYYGESVEGWEGAAIKDQNTYYDS